MKKIGLLVLTLLSISLCAQENKNLENFKIDFTKALDKKFSEIQLDKMFNDYKDILKAQGDVTQLLKDLKGNETRIFPLYNFKNEKLYTDNINYLLNSENSNHRVLGYLVAACSYDTSKVNILLSKIMSEEKEGNIFWGGVALFNLNCNNTTELFDFLVKNEDFGDAHMIPLFFQLNKDSLQHTAYNRIDNKDLKSKILAAQTLAVTPLNLQTENILKEAVVHWDTNIKGYAIYSLKELHVGNLLTVLKPLLIDDKTRAISLQALANSPTKEDGDYLFELIAKQDTVQRDLLDCLYDSKKNEYIKFWLKLLYTRNIPTKYYFSVINHPLIGSEIILSDLQTALKKVKDKNILGELVRALKDRNDDKSVEIIASLLNHKKSTVRYWTAKTVENNQSYKFKSPEMVKLIQQGLQDGNTPND